MNAEELNRRAEMIINMANQGMTPQNFAQQMFGGQMNNYQMQINQTMTQIKNMAQGKPLPEFYMQLLKQNGLTEQNAEGLARLMGMKK